MDAGMSKMAARTGSQVLQPAQLEDLEGSHGTKEGIASFSYGVCRYGGVLRVVASSHNGERNHAPPGTEELTKKAGGTHREDQRAMADG